MKKNGSSRYILSILALSVLVISAAALTGCAGQMENLFTRPQKVTIEHNATVEPTPTETPTPTPTPSPTPTPTPTVKPDADGSSTETAVSGDSSSAGGNTTGITGTDPAANGNGAAANTTGQTGQEEKNEAELPEGTLEPVGVTKEEADAAAEALHEKVIEAANYRLDNGYYSKETLIAGLMEDGFTWEEATYGAEHCYIDWGY